MQIKDRISEKFGGFICQIKDSDNYIRMKGGTITNIIHIHQVMEEWKETLDISFFTETLKNLLKLQEILQIDSIICFEFIDKNVYIKSGILVDTYLHNDEYVHIKKEETKEI